MKSYKKQLLASSALAGAVMIGGNPVLAQDDMGPSVALSGFYFMDGHFADEDGQDNNTAMFLEHDLEVHFNASNELDNGLKVGAHIEFEGSGGARVDDHWITVDGGWGRVLLGGTDGVNVKTMVVAPSHPYGVTSGLQTDWFAALAGSRCVFRCPLGGARLDAGTDDAGVHYFSPRFNGFQFAVGYRPEATNAGSLNRGAINENTDQNNAVDVAVNYSGELGGVGIRASIAGGAAQAPNMMAVPNPLTEADHGHAAAATPSMIPNPNGDYEHVAGGVQLSAMGFTVGGHVANEGTDGPQNGTSFGAGISYATGPWQVAVDMFSGTSRGRDDGVDNEYDAWSVGGQYTIGPGLRALAGFQSGTLDMDNAASIDASAFSVGVAVNF